ncbi:WD40 repeat protein [Nocardioides luteus]|uniref:Anaphase-promoting complex subunit 4 WD40 domain-containing protein n=1 Tax=Nocardioides luteus TaxID=1844 RepID=A0ABQ5T2A1_9ACTN|nr:PQQ-binding-like beta-propeller repeat protein [Nocardioides luteus]MDR7311570.1 WD40 repeat protein [Nocardioides luteus]GGR54697.1 hypothetical protein GCM10010197_21530 [Nocardioides luteus]GLJ70219.1 hypothetical protein GCM10017579_42550 [Nocardioides luteus]
MALTFGQVKTRKAAPPGAAGDGLKADLRTLESSRDALEAGGVPASWQGLAADAARTRRATSAAGPAYPVSMRPRTRLLSAPLIGVLAAALLAGCAGDRDKDGCDISAAGGSFSLAAAIEPTRLDARSVVTDPDGKYVVASCSEGMCRWDRAGGAYETVSKDGYGAISADLALVARKVGCSDVALVEVDGGEQVQRLEGLPNPKVTDASPVGPIAFSPDGELVAAAGLEGDLIIWSVEDGEEVASADLEGGIGSISFSPDGELVAVTGGDSVTILETDSGEEAGKISAASGVRPAWSSDGRWLAGATTEGYPTIWNTTSFEAVESLPGGGAVAVAFSPDASSLAVVTAQPMLSVWTPKGLGGSGADRDVTRSVPARSEVLFSPDGRTVFTASAAEGVAAWDLATGKPAAELDQPPLDR